MELYGGQSIIPFLNLDTSLLSPLPLLLPLPPPRPHIFPFFDTKTASVSHPAQSKPNIQSELFGTFGMKLCSKSFHLKEE